MDFDEYDYLEKTVENPKPQKVKETPVGGDETVKSGDRERSRSSKHKSNEKDDGERRSSRSLRSRDSERHHQRSSREYGDRDKEEKNGRDKDRDRDRNGDRVRGHDRDRDRRERGREVEREKERERPRRSRSRLERHHSDRDEREREKNLDGDNREKEREDLRERDKGSRQTKEKKEEAKEPEADPERDQRTVFAYQISLKATERDVYEFFSRAGKVRDARLILDRNSRRSKGCGYIEFFDAMSVPMAIALSGQPLLGQPVMVKPSEAEKNQVQSTTAAGGSGLAGPSGAARKLYVGNLHTNITEDNLRQVFEAFGTVELVQLPLDETGHCKGFGFVQFAHLEDAKNAMSLNGQLEIAGRAIKVSAVTDQPGMQDLGTITTADLDDEEGGGLSLNARSRAFLMQKLDRSGTASSITGSVGTTAFNSSGLTLPMPPNIGAAPMSTLFPAPLGSIPGFPGLGGMGVQIPTSSATLLNAIGTPSECLLLKNMFDPEVELEPNFDLDIKDDVEEECSRFGKLKHIYVDKNTAGFVYLRFENSESAVNSQRALHGRWFAGKMITATFMDCQSYEARFPDCGLVDS